MEIVTLADAQAHLPEIAEDIDELHERVTIARDGRRHLVIMAADELESIEATLELLADPEAQERITEAEAAIAAGDVHTVGDLKADLEERRRGSAA